VNTTYRLRDSHKQNISIGLSLIVCLLLFAPVKADDYYTYLGGALSDTAYAITSDAQGNIYVTGNTNSATFDGFDPIQNKFYFNQNCFITRVNLQNPNKNYYFEFAGNERESCRAIAVDSNGNVYVTGETQSTNLPMTTNQAFGGQWDAFVIKLDRNGELDYASYIGGELVDYGHGIAIKDEDNVFITGETWSQNFPTTDNAYMQNCVTNNACDGEKANAFIAQIDTSNPNLYHSNYSSYLGGKNHDKAHAIAIDGNGILHIAGETGSSDFPLANSLSNRLKGSFDGFISHIDPSLSSTDSLVFSTYLGGNGDDFITAIAADASGNSYVTGDTTSDDFPTTSNSFSQQCANGKIECLPDNSNSQHTDIFVSKFRNNKLIYSTLFGGTKNETAHAIGVNSENHILLTGKTFSDNFPLTDNANDSRCNQTTQCATVSDGVVIKIDPDGNGKNSLLYASYLGGNQSDTYRSLQINASGELLLTGETESSNIASTSAIDKTAENLEAFLQKLTIDNHGTWVEEQTVTKTRVTNSALNPYYLLSLLLISLVLRRFRTKISLDSYSAIS